MRPRRPPELFEVLLVLGGVVFLLLTASPLFQELGAWRPGVMDWVLIGVPMGMALVAFGPGGLGLRRPGWRGLSAATIIGASLWIVIAIAILPLQEWISPTPPELLRQLQAIAAPAAGTVVALVSAALSPAICEELLFRGLLLPALRKKLCTWAAILISATLFGLLHGSVHRFAPTFVLGISLGAVAVAAGTWASMVVHFLNNAAVIFFSSHAGEPIRVFVDAHTYVALAVAGIAVGAGHVMLISKKTTG